MSTTKFIPQIWSAKTLDVLENALTYSKLYNTDYEGEITDAGDTVHIAQIGVPTIKDYTRGSAIDSAEDVSVTDQTLTIDQAKYFNIAVDDVDAVQSKVSLLDTATQRAAYGFADACDAYLGKQLAAAAGITLGSAESPVNISDASSAYEVLINIKTKLDTANLPKQNRVVIVPPEFEGLMLLDSRFVNVTNQSEERLTEGTVYKAAGFEVAVSNNCPTPSTGVFQIVASSPIQGTFAQQILKTEAYRPEGGFSDAVKGLHVYGAKTLHPEAVACATVLFE